METDSEKPGVAVVIPLYNGGAWIRATLQSVFAQTFVSAEVVVVDDGSTDGGESVVREFPAVRYLRNPEKGPNLARRFGCDRTSAPLITFLDQDDIWHPEHLAIHAGFLATHQRFNASQGSEIDFREPDKPLVWGEGSRRPVYLNAWSCFPLGPRVGTPSSVVIRRSALNAIGGWPAENSGMTDYFAWLALSANGTAEGGFAASPFASTARRRHSGSHSATLRKDPVVLERYADSLLAASMVAAERFGPQSSLDRATLRRRVEVAKVFHGLCCRPQAGEWTLFRREGEEMARLTAGESEFFKRKMAGMLVWMLNAPRRRDEAIELFGRMAGAWPEEDAIPKEVFARKRDGYREIKKAGRVH